MSYYIKGNKERWAEVIKALEEKGGINTYFLGGNDTRALYYINKKGDINYANDSIEIAVIENLCEELTLPEKPKWKPKFKIGDYVRIGYESIPGVILSINTDKHLYNTKYFDGSGEHNYGEDLLKIWEPQRGEPVLVRDADAQIWKEANFSFKAGAIYYVLGGSSWIQCIPFDINKLGKL